MPIEGATSSSPGAIECTEKVKAPPAQKQTEEPPSTRRGRWASVIPIRWSKKIGDILLVQCPEQAGPLPPPKQKQEPPKATSTSMGVPSPRLARVGNMPIRYTTEIGKGLLSSPVEKAQPRQRQRGEREPTEARGTGMLSTSTRRGRSRNIRMRWSKKIGDGWVTSVMESKEEGLPTAKAAEEEEEEEEEGEEEEGE